MWKRYDRFEISNGNEANSVLAFHGLVTGRFLSETFGAELSFPKSNDNVMYVQSISLTPVKLWVVIMQSLYISVYLCVPEATPPLLLPLPLHLRSHPAREWWDSTQNESWFEMVSHGFLISQLSQSSSSSDSVSSSSTDSCTKCENRIYSPRPSAVSKQFATRKYWVVPTLQG